jgi:hypothetical protein
MKLRAMLRMLAGAALATGMMLTPLVDPARAVPVLPATDGVGIPLDEEYVLAMQLHADLVVGFMRERLAAAGVSIPDATVTGRFAFDDATPDLFDGSYFQRVVWRTVDQISDMVLSAAAGFLEAESTLAFILTGEGVWTDGPMAGHRVTSTGVYKESSDKRGAVVIEIQTEGDEDAPIPFDGVITGTLEKVKRDGKLTATGSASTPFGDIDLRFTLDQASRTYTSNVALGAVGAFTNQGRYADQDVAYAITGIAAPSPVLLLAAAASGLLVLRRAALPRQPGTEPGSTPQRGTRASRAFARRIKA